MTFCNCQWVSSGFICVQSTCTNNNIEPQVKKHLTAEERAMRRAEMARRRKNLSEKRNEEEKVRVIELRRYSTQRILTSAIRWIPSTDC